MALKAGLTRPRLDCMPVCQITLQGKPASWCKIYSWGLWLLQGLDGFWNGFFWHWALLGTALSCREQLTCPRSSCSWERAMGCCWPQHPEWRAGASNGAAQQAPDFEVPQQRMMKGNQMSQLSHAVDATGRVLNHWFTVVCFHCLSNKVEGPASRENLLVFICLFRSIKCYTNMLPEWQEEN